MTKLNPTWRDSAFRLFPEHTELIKNAETPYMLWIELFNLFKSAYIAPKKEEFIVSVYRYAAWCEEQPVAKNAKCDLLTCVNVCFYEEIPRCMPALLDLPNWLTKDQFVEIRKSLSGIYSDDELSKIDFLIADSKFRVSVLPVFVT